MSDSELSASTDLLGPLPERWYCVNADGLALLCESQEDAERYATGLDVTYPSRAPHRAVPLGDVASERERCEVLRQALLKCKTCALPTEVRDLVNAALRA